MTSDVMPLQLRTRYISGLVENIQTFLERETGTTYDAGVIETSLGIWLEQRFDRMLEEIGEVITSPHLAESQAFREILEQQARAASPAVETAEAQAAAAATAAQPAPAETIFNGKRPFSREKLAAMIEYIARSGRDIYKTNLNKLLFYSDMTAYYLYGRGISGATYVNLPFGPVPDQVNAVVDEAAEAGRIMRGTVQGLGINAVMFKPGAAPPKAHEELSADERRVLDWVLDAYGHLSPSQITELSHTEKAYASTRPNEAIAYEYAKFFKRLPEKN